MQLAAILNYLPFKKSRPSVDRRTLMQAVPVRNRLLEWSVDDEERVVLRVPRRRDRWGKILERIVATPEYRQVVLDEVGSDVWNLCDGDATVESIVRALVKKHQLNRREVELSLELYLKTLARRGFIGLFAPAAGGRAGERESGRE